MHDSNLKCIIMILFLKIIQGRVNGAWAGFRTGGLMGAFTAGMGGFALESAGDATWGFGQKAWECWF